MGVLMGSHFQVPEPKKMVYEEAPEAQAFFVPYTWEVIHTHTIEDLEWRQDRIQVCISLFHPDRL